MEAISALSILIFKTIRAIILLVRVRVVMKRVISG
jgi:hypothetical protein